MADITVEKKDILKEFFVRYNNYSKKFYGKIKVDSGGFEINANTEEFENIDEALTAVKELLIKVYVKAEN